MIWVQIKWEVHLWKVTYRKFRLLKMLRMFLHVCLQNFGCWEVSCFVMRFQCWNFHLCSSPYIATCFCRDNLYERDVFSKASALEALSGSTLNPTNLEEEEVKMCLTWCYCYTFVLNFLKPTSVNFLNTHLPCKMSPFSSFFQRERRHTLMDVCEFEFCICYLTFFTYWRDFSNVFTCR